MCLNMTRSGAIDGCGADASWQTGVDQAQEWGLTAATAEAWDAGHKQMMRDTTAALAPHVSPATASASGLLSDRTVAAVARGFCWARTHGSSATT